MEAVAEATPLSVRVHCDILALLECCYRTTDRHNIKRTDIASRFAQGSVASASACLAGLSKCAALSRPSFDNTSLAVAMARGTLLCAHSPTTLTNPDLEPYSADLTFSPPALRIYSNRAHPRHVSMPSCNDMEYIRKLSL